MDALKNWLNSDPVEEGASLTAGDYLRSFIENLFKAFAEFMSFLGEWPISFE